MTGIFAAPVCRISVWAQLITFTEVGSLAVAVSLITTALKLRAPVIYLVDCSGLFLPEQGRSFPGRYGAGLRRGRILPHRRPCNPA